MIPTLKKISYKNIVIKNHIHSSKSELKTLRAQWCCPYVDSSTVPSSTTHPLAAPVPEIQSLARGGGELLDFLSYTVSLQVQCSTCPVQRSKVPLSIIR